jgi:hypothetical protein
MGYVVYLTDGNPLSNDLVLDVSEAGDGSVVDNSKAPFALLRRGARNYADDMSTALVRITENFRNSTPPAHPLEGQLWFNTGSGGELRLYQPGYQPDPWRQVAFADQLGQGLPPAATVTLTGHVTGSGNFNNGSLTLNTTLQTVLAGANPNQTFTNPTISVDEYGRVRSIVAGGGTSAQTIINALGYTPLRNDSDNMSGSLGVAGNLNVGGKVMEGGYALLPAGAIIMWSGATNNIPGGWALCNGQPGTPNLTDKFIMGAGSVPTHTVGGNSFLSTTGFGGTITVSAAGAHSHNISMGSAGGHSHGGSTGYHSLSINEIPPHQHATAFGESPGRGYAGRYGNTGTTNNAGSNGGIDYDNYDFLTSSVGLGYGHAHSINLDGDHTHSLSLSDAGSHSHDFSFDNRPAFYALAFIIKL